MLALAALMLQLLLELSQFWWSVPYESEFKWWLDEWWPSHHMWAYIKVLVQKTINIVLCYSLISYRKKTIIINILSLNLAMQHMHQRLTGAHQDVDVNYMYKRCNLFVEFSFCYKLTFFDNETCLTNRLFCNYLEKLDALLTRLEKVSLSFVK